MIAEFQGEHRFLSNFWPCEVRYADLAFNNSESAYQWSRLRVNAPAVLLERFLTTTGAEAKKLVKEYKQFSRMDWHQVKLGIMTEIIHAKFTQNKDLRNKLLLTYPQQLTETNLWHDTFWGVCNGVGTNWLGRILMAERVFWLDLTANKDMYQNDARVRDYEQHQRQAVCRTDNSASREALATPQVA